MFSIVNGTFGLKYRKVFQIFVDFPCDKVEILFTSNKKLLKAEGNLKLRLKIKN